MWGFDPNNIDIDVASPPPVEGAKPEETPVMYEPTPTSGNTTFCYTCSRDLTKLPDGMVYQDTRQYTTLEGKRKCYLLSLCMWCRRSHFGQ